MLNPELIFNFQSKQNLKRQNCPHAYTIAKEKKQYEGIISSFQNFSALTFPKKKGRE